MTESDWTKTESAKAEEILERAAGEMIALGMAPVGPWRKMLLVGIQTLSEILTPTELLVDIGKTRNWLDVLEREARAKSNGG